jgi:hypothetical protein
MNCFLNDFFLFLLDLSNRLRFFLVHWLLYLRLFMSRAFFLVLDLLMLGLFDIFGSFHFSMVSRLSFLLR